MKLHELKPAAGSRKDKKRLGRGMASGHGKTPDVVKKVKMPVPVAVYVLVLKGDKTRFTAVCRNVVSPTSNRKEYAIVNLDTLNRFEEGTVVTPELLAGEGVVKNLKDGLKVLANGELK